MPATIRLVGGTLVIPVALGLVLSLGAARAQDHSSTDHAKPGTLMPGMGDLHHSICTKIPEVQKFFDQGLTLVYAFNHEEAVRSFRRAADLAVVY